ncbi:hypothetical protein AB0M46_13600 [Dactylosporangium sp. NPDC051485]|uniref:hypothetical protein n=1 Tax=Dactylosporangium sp. NPDC051485 TaxID=3154846 RepID=UPI003437909A
MAGVGTNAAVQRLRDRQAAQLRAVDAFEAAAGRVLASQERRAAAVARLDATVAAAGTDRDVALVVLADLVGDDAAAEVTGVPVAEVRIARRRAEVDAVRAGVAAVRQAPGRSGRGRRPGGAAARDVGADVPRGPVTG